MKHYACAIRDVVKKMGWHTISFVLSADYEGKVFADEMYDYSREAKWDILHTIWIFKSQQNSTELRTLFKRVMTNDSDVVVVHVHDPHNDGLFRLVENLGVNQFRAVWLLTDITTLGVSNTNDLPVGFMRISPWKNLRLDYVEHALYDTFHLIELSATGVVEMSCDSNNLLKTLRNNRNADLQRLMKK